MADELKNEAVEQDAAVKNEDAAQPGATELDVTQPGATEPDVAQPAATEPAAAEPSKKKGLRKRITSHPHWKAGVATVCVVLVAAFGAFGCGTTRPSSVMPFATTRKTRITQRIMRSRAKRQPTNGAMKWKTLQA